MDPSFCLWLVRVCFVLSPAPDGVLQALPQRYERRSATTYWYESPTAGYAELLELAPSGFVRRYPGLWEAVA